MGDTAKLLRHKDRLGETQNRKHRIGGVRAEDVPFLRELDINSEVLEIYQEYCRINLKGLRKLLVWQVEHNVKHNVLPILEHMTAHKFMKYMDEQFPLLQGRKAQHGGHRYRTMQDVVNEYSGYLEILRFGGTQHIPGSKFKSFFLLIEKIRSFYL